MTHVAHPYGLRLGIIRDWKNRFFTSDKRVYRDRLKIDLTTREFLEKRLKGYFVDSIETTHTDKEMRIKIKTSRPGMVIGRNGEESAKILEELKKRLKKLRLQTEMPQIAIDVEEVRTPETSASIVAQMIVDGLEKRMSHKRVAKQMLEKVMATRQVEGVRIRISGRLGGADMARAEEFRRGRVPLQTLRADIDYAHKEAIIPQGVLGVKVWIYKGDIFNK